jgi:hypothetical protein
MDSGSEEEDPVMLQGTIKATTRDGDSALTGTMEYEYNLEDVGGRCPIFFSYLPRLVHFDNAHIDAIGCASDMFARATVFMSSIFLGPALLELAS